MSGVSPVLVGRSAELEVLERAFADARDGSATAVLVGGEAGIGKSRFVREFISRTGDARVLLGGCLELGAEGFPFAPFSAMLRGLIREIGMDGVTELLPSGARRGLARLLPEAGEVDAEPESGSADARARLFEQMLLLLERLAERSPVLVVIEDAHWADPSTRDLLAFLIRNLGNTPDLLVVVTYRSDELHRSHPLRPWVAELGRVEGVHRMELSRLGRREVAQLTKVILGREPGEAVVDNAYRRSEGNPFFVEAIVTCDDGACEGIPESLRDLLLAGVQKLPDETQDVLRNASVGGVRIDHDLLATVTELNESALSRALRPAVAANVLVVDGEAYAFRHSLIREALHDDLLPGEHTRLHTRYAEALDNDPSLVPAGRAAAALAHHWYAAHDMTWALFSAWNASEVAKKAVAYQESFDMLERVLKLWDKVPDAAERIGAEHIDVLGKAVMVAFHGGCFKRGLALIEQALPEAEGDAADTAYFLEMRGRFKRNLGLTGVLEDLRAAVRIAPADPPGLPRARALATLADNLGLASMTTEARDVATEALAIAREIGDVTAEVHAMATVAVAGRPPGELDRILKELADARALAEKEGLSSGLVRIITMESDRLEAAGEHERAIEVARNGVATSHTYGLARTQGALLAMNVAEPMIALGRWDEALEVIDHSLDLSPPAVFRASLHQWQGHIAVARGELSTAEDLLTRARDVLSRSTPEAQFLGPAALLEIELRLAQGDPERALDAFAAVTATGELTWSPRYQLPVLTAAARACSLATGPDLRERALALLGELMSGTERLPASGRPQNAWRLTFQVIAEDAAAALGTAGAARPGTGRWDAVATAWEELGEPYPQARALRRAAEAAAAEGQRNEVAVRLRRAVELAEKLGARPLRGQIENLARRAGVQLTESRPADPGHGLTPRELEVLRLVAEGRSNRDIASELFISAKTASVHVSNILTKLGVAGRGEAAATAHRRGLVVTS